MAERIHAARFVAKGVTVRIVQFDSGGLKCPIPDTPRIKGMAGRWGPTELGDSDVTIKAIYRPARIRFLQCDGSESEADAGGPYPIPMPIRGFEGEWEPFAVGYKDVTVRAIYRGPSHTIVLFADGKRFATVGCPSGEFPKLPQPPRKKGFKARWPAFDPTPRNIRIEAVYEPISIVCHTGIGKSIAIKYDQNGFSLPPVPKKPGFTGKWEDYYLGTSDIDLKPVYIKTASSVSAPQESAGIIRENVRKALDDLYFVSEMWSSIEEEPAEKAPNPTYNINLTHDTEEETGWASFAGKLSPFQKEYLASLAESSDPSAVLKKHGQMRMAAEAELNALAESLLGDPIIDVGKLDPDYIGEILEVVKDGN